MSRFSSSSVTAILGPTNTGKTFLAMERMLGHESGVIGFPLRLLARENYERVARAKGRSRVALVTGEEKIVPPQARYFCCTVESMPLQRGFAFLAVDEIQIAADPERGHIFTDRLLRARGYEETMFLGSETVRPVVRALVPEAEHITRPRFSKLSYSGEQRLSRLPRRSAIVAFSAAEVYATAELVRRRRGGAAVVLGALSPRTRNAQVEMFEAGEVDYLVATDAIGMGLNLNLDHVAFADLGKFDGRRRRGLVAPELAQIAGRAGRHMSDGTFGTTLDIGPIPTETVEAMENHQFEKVRAVFWRNRDLDFKCPKSLLASLERKPPSPELLRVRDAEDHQALRLLAEDPEAADRAADPATVRLLWDVCQIPDFRKDISDRHVRLLGRIFSLLCEHDGRLPDDWLARQVKRIDRQDGDIDLLTQRIGQIRTWTYVSHRGDWLADPAHWRERTRDIEDRLSDALHERLTQRFVDKRTTLLMQRLRDRGHLLGAVRANGEVLVEGEPVGKLEGFRFLLDESLDKDTSRPLLAAARRAMQSEISRQLQRLESDDDGCFRLEGGRFSWRGHAVATLKGGDDLLVPRVVPLADVELDGGDRERLRRRLAGWLERHLRRRLAPLFALREAKLKGPARGVAFQVAENLGVLPRAEAATRGAHLTRDDRKMLTGIGLRLGMQSYFLPALVGNGSAPLRVMLWGLRSKVEVERQTLPKALLVRVEDTPGAGFVMALGFVPLRPLRGSRLAVRADALERLAIAARRLSKNGSFEPDERLRAILDCDEETLRSVLRSLGYKETDETREVGAMEPARRKKRRKGGNRADRPSRESPFAVLSRLKDGTKNG